MKSSKQSVRIIVGSILAIALVTLAIGILIPLNMSDGTEKLQGEEKRAAEEAIKDMDAIKKDFFKETVFSYLVFRPELKLRVEEAFEVEIPPTGIYSNCNRLYGVIFSQWTYFGIRIDSADPTFSNGYDRSVCLEWDNVKNLYGR